MDASGTWNQIQDPRPGRQGENGRLPARGRGGYRPGSGAVLARSSQPLVGLMMNFRNNADGSLFVLLAPILLIQMDLQGNCT